MPIALDQSGRPIDTLVATLHHLHLRCADTAKSAEFYQTALGYQPASHGDAVVAYAPERRLILSAGQPKQLVWAGFALPSEDELTRLRARICKAGWPAENGATLLFSDGVTVRDPDGNCFVFGLPKEEAPATSDLPPARLQHVVVSSLAPQQVIRFFIDVLGFTLSDDVVDDAGGVRTSFLRCSQEHHSFAVFQAAENRLDHHCYETSSWNDIRDWADHVSTADIPIQWGPGRHGPGNNLFIFVHDPDGNWIEMSAELEIVPHSRPVGKWQHVEKTLNYWGRGYLRS